MRLMTYNILTGGSDAGNDARLGKICELVESARPDVLILNECNAFDQHGFRNLYRVEQELGMRGVLAPAGSGFHVALFVRSAALVETHCLHREVHHAAIAATLEQDGRRFMVIGAHLSPFGGDARACEVQHLVRFLRADSTFVVGDLNAISPEDAAACRSDAWLPRRRARHLMSGTSDVVDTRAIAVLEQCDLTDLFARSNGGGGAATALTRLGNDWENYQVRIDYIFATRAATERVVRRERVDSPLADSASDHYPLFVDVEL